MTTREANGGIPARAMTWFGAPDEIPWQEIAPDGSRYALLEGDRAGSGTPFTYAFYLPGGFWDPPHSHARDARVIVMTGELRLSWGDGADPGATTAYPAGSVLFVPGGAVHFDGAETGTLIIGFAVGPWATTYVDGRTGSAGTPG